MAPLPGVVSRRNVVNYDFWFFVEVSTNLTFFNRCLKFPGSMSVNYTYGSQVGNHDDIRNLNIVYEPNINDPRLMRGVRNIRLRLVEENVLFHIDITCCSYCKKRDF